MDWSLVQQTLRINQQRMIRLPVDKLKQKTVKGSSLGENKNE